MLNPINWTPTSTYVVLIDDDIVYDETNKVGVWLSIKFLTSIFREQYLIVKIKSPISVTGTISLQSS